MRKAVILNDTSQILHPGSRLVSRNITALLKAEGFEVVYTTPYSRFFEDHWIENVIKIRPELILVHGEGGIHHSLARPWVGRLLQSALHIKAELNVPLALINSVVSDLDRGAVKQLEKFDVVNVRDTRSQAYLESQGVKAVAIPDYSLAYPVRTNAQKRRGGIVIDSVLPNVWGDLRRVAQSLDWEWLSMQPAFTRGRFRRLRKLRADQLPFVRSRSEPSKVLNQIGCRAEAITGRFHGLMFCLLMRTPYWAIPSNSHKINSASIDVFGNEKRVFSMSKVMENLARKNIKVLPFSDDEEKAIARYQESCESGARELMRKLELMG